MTRWTCSQCQATFESADVPPEDVVYCRQCGFVIREPAPVPAVGDWFYSKDRKKVGPVSVAELRRLLASGQLASTDMVIAAGGQKWATAGSVLGPAPPPRADVEGWFYAKDRQRVGPLTLEQIRERIASGVLRPTDMLLQSGTQRWLAAEKVPGLVAPRPAKPLSGEAVVVEGWFYPKAGKRVGPVSIAELKVLVASGALGPSDRVLHAGTAKWVAVSSVPELVPPVAAPAPSPPVPVEQPSLIEEAVEPATPPPVVAPPDLPIPEPQPVEVLAAPPEAAEESEPSPAVAVHPVFAPPSPQEPPVGELAILLRKILGRTGPAPASPTTAGEGRLG